MNKYAKLFLQATSIIFITLFFGSLASAQPVWNGDYEITSSADIANLSGYTEVTGNLFIHSSALTSLSGLDNLTTVGNSLCIWENVLLTSLNGFESLTSVGVDLDIENNSSLTSLSGLDNLTIVGRDLIIYENGALTSLSALDNLTTVERSLVIGGTAILTSLSGLNNITSLGGSLGIEYNSALTSLNGLNSLTSVGVNLRIGDNGALTSLNGLDNLTIVEGFVYIYSNSVLISLSGFDNLITVGDFVIISNNDTLISLSGLDSLISVDGYLKITGNHSLTDLCALYNVNIVNDDNLKITYNSVLSMATAYALETRLRSNGFAGTADIHDNNGTGLVSCATLIDISSFTAVPKNKKVIIKWSTESEADSAGFNIYRAEKEEGDYEQINDLLISAEGSITEGAEYEFIDDDVKNRKTYYYKLEDIDMAGMSNMQEPVNATPRLIYIFFR